MRPLQFDEEHQNFRESFQRFAENAILPHYDAWEDEGIVPREVWSEAGRHGFLGMQVPERYGGGGADDFRFNVVVTEELARLGTKGVAFELHNDICLPYFLEFTTHAQKQRWLPGLVAGESIAAIAMTEPGAGSDLSGILTSARRDRNHYIINGSKTFISNGILNDLVIVAAKTDFAQGKDGISLLVVERGMEGYYRGRNLRKIGQKAQDTAELFFDNVRIPAENLLGREGAGFSQLVSMLPQERLSIAVTAVANAESALERTIRYCKERTAFGQPIGSFQNSKFVLAELATEVDLARVYVDHCITQHMVRQLTPETAAKAKWWTTELQVKVADRCLQLHGGYGYMHEYWISRAFADARITTIYGGTTEIVKGIVARSLGL